MTFVSTATGAFYAFGRNNTAQLGDGALSGLRDITDIAAGYNFTIVLKADQTVWTFGANAAHQLGRDGVPFSAAPVQVAGLENVVT